MNQKIDIAVAKGDGIGPEIMDAVLRLFEADGVPFNYHYVEMGKSIFDKGFQTGMTDEAKETVEKFGVLYKGPMETPKGKGVKSINVTARKVWSTYANVRRFKTIPGVNTVFSQAGIPINMTILRENIEDTYGGIEFMHTNDVALTYRLISRPGSEQFFRYCFEYTKSEGFTKLACAHKANIMKLTDGMYLNTFYEVAKDYPEIEVEDFIIDDLAMKLVRIPDKFQVVACTNLQGDIVSDLCAGLVGGLGFAPSANIGDNICIFEAVHGTAPDIAGKHVANPSALLMSGLMLLRHFGLHAHADRIENAWLYTLENEMFTADCAVDKSKALNTPQFTDAIISHLGKEPQKPISTVGGKSVAKVRNLGEVTENRLSFTETKEEVKVVGGDFFVWHNGQPEEVVEKVSSILPSDLEIVMISNRGTQVYPTKSVFTDLVNHHRVRIATKDESDMGYKRLYELAAQLSEVVTVVNLETLKHFGENRGYSLAQGQ